MTPSRFKFACAPNSWGGDYPSPSWERSYQMMLDEMVFAGCTGIFRVLGKNNYSGWMVVEQDVTYGATVVPPVESVAAGLKYRQKVAAILDGAKVF